MPKGGKSVRDTPAERLIEYRSPEREYNIKYFSSAFFDLYCTYSIIFYRLIEFHINLLNHRKRSDDASCTTLTWALYSRENFMRRMKIRHERFTIIFGQRSIPELPYNTGLWSEMRQYVQWPVTSIITYNYFVLEVFRRYLPRCFYFWSLYVVHFSSERLKQCSQKKDFRRFRQTIPETIRIFQERRIIFLVY